MCDIASSKMAQKLKETECKLEEQKSREACEWEREEVNQGKWKKKIKTLVLLRWPNVFKN